MSYFSERLGDFDFQELSKGMYNGGVCVCNKVGVKTCLIKLFTRLKIEGTF